MKTDIRQFLHEHGWVRCDRCVGWVMLPRRTALKRGWVCGGIAGHYDYCARCSKIQERRRAVYDSRVYDGTGCWAGEPDRPAVECGRLPVGPAGLCEWHVKELNDIQ